MSHHRTQWIICKGYMPPHKKINLPRPNPVVRILDAGPPRIQDDDKKHKLLSKEEERACMDLFEFWQSRGGNAGSYGVREEVYKQEHEKKNDHSQKFSLIKDIQVDHFYDLIGLVQKVW